MKIPITMCHGINEHLTVERFAQYIDIARELGFNSINYDELYAWLTGTGLLPERPIMFDFDHPNLNVYRDIFPILRESGFTGNLFINTGYFDIGSGDDVDVDVDAANQPACASWSQVDELKQAGWTIGAHTHTHPNLSELAVTDLSGEVICAEMEKCNAILKENLGMTPQYFAFTGNANGGTWSDMAGHHAKRLYRLGRLWIIGSTCEVNGKTVRYADFVGDSGADEVDGGPPYATRYITKNTQLFKLPSMELEGLIYEPDAFRDYLMGAIS